MMETIDDIVREIREVVSKYGVKAFGQIMFARGDLADRLEIANKALTERLERAETAWKNWNSAYCTEAAENVSLKEDNSKMKKVVDALNNCDGVKRCIEKGCESCRHNGHDCNSHEVIKAFHEYIGEDK